MSLRDDLFAAISFADFWAGYYPDIDKRLDDQLVLCPFHNDTTPSLNISIKKGVYQCKAPNCAVKGDVVHYYAGRNNISYSLALARMAKGFNLIRDVSTVPPISQAVVDRYHVTLLNNAPALLFLKNNRALGKDIITKYKLGYEEKRITIPVLDEAQNIINIRKHRPGAPENKVISYGKGYGSPKIFPIDQAKLRLTDKEWLYITEGELDALVLISLGMHAVTGTGGSGFWKKEWSDYFVGKNIAITYDTDEPGKTGALLVAKALIGVARQIKILTLPVTGEHNDVTDYVVHHGALESNFIKLIEEADTYKTAGDLKRDENRYKVTLDEASNAQYSGKKIQVLALVSGKDLAPYILPSEVYIECGLDYKPKVCVSCPVGLATGQYKAKLTTTPEQLIEMTHVSTSLLERSIKNALGIPVNCFRCKISKTKSTNVESVILTPMITFSFADTIHVHRKSYFVGDGSTKVIANRAYKFNGVTIPHPRTQFATHVLYEASPTKDNLDNFKMTPERKKQLKALQLKDTTIKEKFNEIAEDLELVTGIYKRRDLLMVADLTFHSVLSFTFCDRLLRRGWLQALVIGDTRCGKTATLDALIRHYRAGEIISGESVSFAGLVGGLQQLGSTYTLSWGKVPLNDRRLIVIDEISGMDYDDIGSMSSMRSSGIAEVTKIHTEKTSARTRQIWLSNVRGTGRRLNSYAQGVLAIKQLIGRLEDISRFDLFLTMSSEEVPMDDINKMRTSITPKIYTDTLCADLVMWAWSRRPEHVIFEKGVEEYILGLAIMQGKKYSPTIPLVEGAEQREKLARIAVAIAARLFSTDDEGELVIVKKIHATFAFEILEQLYEKPSMGYTEYSELELKKNTLDDEIAIAGFMTTAISDSIMDMDKFLKSDLDMVFGDYSDVKSIIALLLKNRAIRRSARGYYVKTPAFIYLLRERRYIPLKQAQTGSTY